MSESPVFIEGAIAGMRGFEFGAAVTLREMSQPALRQNFRGDWVFPAAVDSRSRAFSSRDCDNRHRIITFPGISLALRGFLRSFTSVTTILLLVVVVIIPLGMAEVTVLSMKGLARRRARTEHAFLRK